MKILGIDPGTATTGFGVIDIVGGKPQAINWGLIETGKEDETSLRFVSIFSQMSKIIRDNKPDVFAMERLFFATNAKTAIRVGQAQGVMIYCAARHNIQVFEYAPGTIKKLITGDGRADKKMVQKSLRKIFGNKIRSKAYGKTHFDNAADALAVALTHVLKTKNV